MAKVKVFKREVVIHGGQEHEYLPEAGYHEIPYFHAKQLVKMGWAEYHPDFNEEDGKAEEQDNTILPDASQEQYGALNPAFINGVQAGEVEEPTEDEDHDEKEPEQKGKGFLKK